MSEDAPQFPPADESKRIEDPEKAHAMALAGNAYRSGAAIERHLEGEAMEEDDHQGADHHHNAAAEYDAHAVGHEIEAGKQYDTEQAEQQPAPEVQEAAEELGSAAVEATQIPVQDGEAVLSDTGSTQWDEDKARTVGMAVKELDDQVRDRIAADPERAQDLERFDNDTERRDRRLNGGEDYYEALYNLNPQLFANMPTSEFMAIRHEIAKINQDLREAEEKVQQLSQQKQKTMAKYEPGGSTAAPGDQEVA
jgi:F0F1-type ATP synthase membrane subunit b/b'